MSDDNPFVYLEEAASGVRDAVTGGSMWAAKMVGPVRPEDGGWVVPLLFSAEHSTKDKKAMVAALKSQLKGLGCKADLRFELDQQSSPSPKTKEKPPSTGDQVPGMTGPGIGAHGGPVQKASIPGVQHIIAVASGKGGVGKSTVATNLAVGLKKLGYAVGLIDADIYGPSLPQMMNVESKPMADAHQRIVPVLSYGVRCISMGLLVDTSTAMIWRGPMVMNAVRQFLQKTAWEGTDYLIVDLPPGTGDAQLTLIQAVALSGAVIVTTPQPVALADAVRGVSMFKKLEVPILGVVENMAYYELPDGERDYVFGDGGGRRMAETHQLPVLAQVPLRTSVRSSGDQGIPAVLGEDNTAEIFMTLAKDVAAALPVSSP